MAADALGWSAAVSVLPDPDQPNLLARLDLVPSAPSRHAPKLLQAIDRRCTDRRRFTSWPVPEEPLTTWQPRRRPEVLAHSPSATSPSGFHAELLINRALDVQDANGLLTHEQQSWIDHGGVDGVPRGALPLPRDVRSRRPSRFVTGLVDDMGGGEVGAPDGLVVLCAPADDPLAWLTAGEGLSALWLAATAEGLSVVPISQVIEVAETRAAFELEVLGGLARPLVVIRVGSAGDQPPPAGAHPTSPGVHGPRAELTPRRASDRRSRPARDLGWIDGCPPPLIGAASGS